MIAESAIMNKAKVVQRGIGVYALKRFRGRKEKRGGLTFKMLPGDEIGYYGGRVVAMAETKLVADRFGQALVWKNKNDSRYLLTVDAGVIGMEGYIVIDGEKDPVLPYLHRVNDPRGTELKARCAVDKYGLFTALVDIPALDMTIPLRKQSTCELSFEYGDKYWHDFGLSQGEDLLSRSFAKMGMNKPS